MLQGHSFQTTTACSHALHDFRAPLEPVLMVTADGSHARLSFHLNSQLQLASLKP
jgi:hypothetical protein